MEEEQSVLAAARARRRQNETDHEPHGVKPKSTPGPKRGSVDRYAESDRALYPELEALMNPADPKVPKMSRTEASEQLASMGKIGGTTTNPESLAKRLRTRYARDQNLKESVS